MKKIYQYSVLVVCALCISACNKYLDVKPKGYKLLTSTTDYDQWLNSTAVERTLPSELNNFSDSYDLPNLPLPANTVGARAYVWAPQLEPNVTTGAPILPNHYNAIYYFNTVIQGIDVATGAIQQKASLKAEAFLGRAFDYFYLVNEYGKEYDPATASADLAIPFMVSNDLAVPTPPRSTVQQIYDHIIADLNAAIPNLPLDNGKNRYRGSLAAAYSILARTYLYMRNYPQAQKYAELALDNGPNKIVNYGTLKGVNGITDMMIRSDAIYARKSLNFGVLFTPTLDYLKSFDKNDLRLSFYYTNLGDFSFSVRGVTQYISNSGATEVNWGTGVAEMRLIIAECAARSNNLTTALQQLDIVRSNRFTPANYKIFQSTDQAVVLQKVLDERTFELNGVGLRWFDMRRLNAEGKMRTVNRYDALGKIISTLAPNSDRYTLQIPIQGIYFNPDMPQNP